MSSLILKAQLAKESADEYEQGLGRTKGFHAAGHPLDKCGVSSILAASRAT